MPADLQEARGPGVADIVRHTLRNLPGESRRGLALVLVAWAAVLGFQIWDVRDRPAPRAIAELASVLLGTGGFLLFGLTEILRRAEEPTPSASFIRGASLVPESTGLRQILLALPTIGVLASALLAAAAAITVARIWLGTSPIALVIALVYAGAVAATLRVVGQAAGRLYAFGQRESARVAQAEAQLAVARLAALQAQMNPHFLFNALNTVASLIRTDPRTAETTIESLSEVLRTTFQRSQDVRGTLQDELDFVRAYLTVEGQRFGDRLAVEWRIDPAALLASLPPLTIQPLVENALKHGIGHRREGGRIEIAAACEAGRLRVEVADNGDGLPAPHREGTGLGNLRQRLAVLYGTAASLTIDSNADGTCARVDLPFIPDGGPHARADR